MPCEIPDPDSVRARSGPCVLRSRSGEQVLAHHSVGRSGLQGVPCRVHRQGQPGALLLGKLRSRGDSLLWPSGARASRSRPHHSRSLLSRSEQRRVLARRRRYQGTCLLLVRCTGACRLRGTEGPSSGSLLPSTAERVPADVRRRAQRHISKGRADGVPPEHLRCSSQPGKVGSQGLGAISPASPQRRSWKT